MTWVKSFCSSSRCSGCGLMWIDQKNGMIAWDYLVASKNDLGTQEDLFLFGGMHLSGSGVQTWKISGLRRGSTREGFSDSERWYWTEHCRYGAGAGSSHDWLGKGTLHFPLSYVDNCLRMAVRRQTGLGAPLTYCPSGTYATYIRFITGVTLLRFSLCSKLSCKTKDCLFRLQVNHRNHVVVVLPGRPDWT